MKQVILIILLKLWTWILMTKKTLRLGSLDVEVDIKVWIGCYFIDICEFWWLETFWWSERNRRDWFFKDYWKKKKERIKGKNCWEVQVVKKWWGDWEIESSRAQGTMLEFYPPLPGSLNRQGESGPPTMGSAAPPIPFRPANDNNNAGKVNNFF